MVNSLYNILKLLLFFVGSHHFNTYTISTASLSRRTTRQPSRLTVQSDFTPRPLTETTLKATPAFIPSALTAFSPHRFIPLTTSVKREKALQKVIKTRLLFCKVRDLQESFLKQKTPLTILLPPSFLGELLLLFLRFSGFLRILKLPQ